MTALVWFRNDLRLHDNPALAAACQSGKPVEAVFVVTRSQWQQHDMAPVRERFYYDTVLALAGALAKKRIALHLIDGDDFAHTPQALLGLVKRRDITAIYLNDEYEWNERQRDDAVGRLLTTHGVDVHRFHDQCLLPPGSVRTLQGAFFKVYSPFRRAALKQLYGASLTPLAAPRARRDETPSPETVPWSPGALPHQGLWPGGEDEAAGRLARFVQDSVGQYKALRDFPERAGTSALSPYLAVGAVSVRQCLHAARLAGDGSLEPAQPGIACWINELLWREFYRHLVVGFPHVCRHKAFNRETDGIPWRGTSALFDSWTDSKTGYPIVDAAMAQLRETGWMHNRLRMVTAMFLTKHLFTDWRLGERYFMQHLVDGDLASNNGGWQWSASTGADAAPYFRVFNPRLQSERFDPDGLFIRRWIPELRDVDRREVHAPSPLLARSIGYPLPIVEHRSATDDVKRHFGQLAALREHHDVS